MHGKARAIAPSLATLGLRFLPSPPIDTDRFGTFTRDIARTGSQREALIAKARAGLVLVPEAQFAIASEGAFGPHPEFALVPGDLELVGLFERRTGEAIVGTHLTAETNYRQAAVHSWREAEIFASEIGFPGHALIVRSERGGPVLAKGVDRVGDLRRWLEQLGQVWLETDMRADRNPLRMEAIRFAAEDLKARLLARCPRCRFPDWVPLARGGRRCGGCGSATHDIYVEEKRCRACHFSDRRVLNPDRQADPALCVSCNP